MNCQLVEGAEGLHKDALLLVGKRVESGTDLACRDKLIRLQMDG